MRGQCCICSDLFEDDDNINIAAVPCGHTFHEECVLQWLKTSNSCPHCRKHTTTRQVIRKLFFDVGDGAAATPDDTNKVKNELMLLKTKVRQHEHSKNEMEEVNNQLCKQMENVEQKRTTLKKQLREQEQNSTFLRKQLDYYESEKKTIKLERDEYKKAQLKLTELQHVQALLDGCESDVNSIFDSYSEGKAASQQLAHFCLVMKREYEKTKADKRSLRDQLDKIRCELCSKTCLLKDALKELTTSKEHFKQSEEDLKTAEKDKEKLRRKVKQMKVVITSPDRANISGLADTPVRCTPVRCTPVRPDRMDDLILVDSMSPDLFEDTPKTKARVHCSENNINFVKISSANDKFHVKRARLETQDPNNLAALGALNIFKKKMSSTFDTVSRNGYDGFGGHTSFVLGSEKKSKPLKITHALKKKYVRNPTLPSFNFQL